jgi:oxygen-dependent protoporphyrinogen oxidase
MTPPAGARRRPRLVVIGGGISGLTAAFLAAGRYPDCEVTVLEAADAVGGKLAVAEVAGVQVDIGAEAMLTRRPEGLRLVDAVGLTDQLLAPSTLSAAVFAGGALHPLPARTMLGIPGDVEAVRAAGILGPHSLAGIAAEPTRTAVPPLIDDVAVGALVRSRLGDEVVDRLVEPLLGGVYAGRADLLSLRATMPALAARLAGGGSLVAAARAVVDGAGRDVSAGDTTQPVFVSLPGGLGTLPQRLVQAGRFTVRTATIARAIHRTPDGFAIDCGPVSETERVTADAVVVATPAPKSSRLLREVAPAAAAELAAIETASVAIITLAYRDVALPAGSGLLVGAREGLTIKAVTVSSQKWPLPTPLTVLRASVGRLGEPHALQRDDDDLVALVRRDLGRMYGPEIGAADPVDAVVTRWGGALPQYAVGHPDRVAAIRAAVAAVPGLGLCGASYDGLGIPACVASAQQAVDAIGPCLEGALRRAQ